MMTGILLGWLLQSPTPQEVLDQVAKRYRDLGSFSMTIEHSNSSGLYPGSFVQSLHWRKESSAKLGPSGQKATNRFELHVIDRKESQAPDYFCNGFGVLSRWPDGRREYRTPFEDPNTMPGWEVTGGLILGWLQDTANSKLLTHPPEAMKATFAYGDAKEWKGEKVREITLSWTSGDVEMDIHLFLSPKLDRLVGFEWPFQKDVGWAHYASQQFHPREPKSLGDYPK